MKDYIIKIYATLYELIKNLRISSRVKRREKKRISSRVILFMNDFYIMHYVLSLEINLTLF